MTQRTLRARKDRVRVELANARSSLLLPFRLVNIVCRLMPPNSLSTARAALYRAIGIGVGSGVSFLGSITITGGEGAYRRLAVGDGCMIGIDVTFNLDDTVTLGRNVSVSPRVVIYTSTHRLGPASRRMNLGMITAPVAIEDGAWVGAGSIILPGVVIGRGSVVSAGSVVTESVPPNTLMVGNPARAVRELPWPDR